MMVVVMIDLPGLLGPVLRLLDKPDHSGGQLLLILGKPGWHSVGGGGRCHYHLDIGLDHRLNNININSSLTWLDTGQVWVAFVLLSASN